MIKVSILKKTGNFRRITIKDHAESRGEYDLVCAAVSTMFITLANGLDEVVGAEIETRVEPGDSKIEILEKDALKTQKMDVLLDTFELGIKNLSMEYPKFVKLEIVEEKDD